MAKWVVRKNLLSEPVRQATLCEDPGELGFDPSQPTIEECIARMLEDDEICLSGTYSRPIMRGAKLVGHIEILPLNAFADSPQP